MIRVEGARVVAETRTQRAAFERGVLASLVRRSDGRELVKAAGEGPALELVYSESDVSPLAKQLGDEAECLRINDYRAEVRLHGWFGDGVIAIAEDVESGDVVVEPSGYSSRPGLRSVRWTIGGIEKGLKLVAPFFQGVRVELEDPLLAGVSWNWPHMWEAGLAIFEGEGGGFWVHCRDTQYRYKRLHVDAADGKRAVGFETDGYGPMDGNLGAGGLAWRIGVFEGDWRAPAAEYREWLWKAWGLDAAKRPEWLERLRFAVSWCPTDGAILEALAKKLDPKTVLIHLPHWRTDGYDKNYPTFEPSTQGEAFVKRAQAMGFRTMPHFNAIDMDPTHPVYPYLRDFQYRTLEGRKVQGWTWVDDRVLPVPESNAARMKHQDKMTMVKIHPGLAMWRSMLTENVASAARRLALDTVFLDVTLNTWNIHNCLVENQTPTEGMKRLVSEVAAIDSGLAVGGEGRNEITMQDEAFGQVHLFMSWQESIEGLERTGGCELNEFLFGSICKSFGYTGLGGNSEAEEARMRLHLEHGAMPTVTLRGAEDIERPNRAVKEMLERAR